MTVSELIALLKAMPPDGLVLTQYDCSYYLQDPPEIRPVTVACQAPGQQPVYRDAGADEAGLDAVVFT